MMNTAWKKHGVNLSPGTRIRGSWHQKEYKIIRKIGEGVVGAVYLTRWEGQYLALKISKQSASITMEVNVLKSLQRVRTKGLGPLLVDVDDWEVSKGRVYSFYVMEYVKGENLRTFIKKNGSIWLTSFVFQILEQLEELHKIGYIFGDLKMEHVLVEAFPPRIRLIDFGGATKQGRAIKEYTEFYDRGYWGFASRRAEASYDLFSLVLVLVRTFTKGEFIKGSNPKRTLLAKLQSIQDLSAYEAVLKKAIYSQYSGAREMADDLQRHLYRQGEQSQLLKQQKKSSHLKPLLIEVGGLSVMVALYGYLAFIYS